MPRVSEAHLAARRQQILDAAQVCFLRKGFHASTMQDVIAEAHLSVGAVYRYFKGKGDLIEAIAAGYAVQIWDQVAPLVAGDRPLIEAMEAVLAFIDSDAITGPDGRIRLVVQVWAEAVRDEHVAASTRKIYLGFRGNFVNIAARAVESGQLPEGTDPEATGSALLSLALGYALQKVLTGGPTREAYVVGMRALLTR